MSPAARSRGAGAAVALLVLAGFSAATLLLAEAALAPDDAAALRGLWWTWFGLLQLPLVLPTALTVALLQRRAALQGVGLATGAVLAVWAVARLQA